MAENNKPLIDQLIDLSSKVRKARSSLYWGFVNLGILAVLIYDILYTLPRYGPSGRYIQYAAASIFSLNTLYHFGRYFWTRFGLKPISLNERQYKLLGVKENDPHLKLMSAQSPTPKKAAESANDLTPLNMSAPSWMSPSPVSGINDSSITSPNFSMSSSSWMYQSGSSLNMSMSPECASDGLRNRQTSASRTVASPRPATPSSEFIRDMDSLNQYLKDYEVHEKSAVHASGAEQPTNLLSSFWSHPASRTAGEVSPMLRRCAYQLAPPTSVQSPSSPCATNDDAGSPSALYQSQEIWRRFKINPGKLTQWNANLRMWISQTILERLVAEIEIVDAALTRQSISDVRVGQVGLERLRKTAETTKQNIPSLLHLVPFLEISPHQQYVVARIRELAKGGCMSEFRWNGGGSFNGKAWDENMPTDAALVMHLFSTYLDSQLLPLPQNPDGRSFSTQHFFKSPDKPPKSRNTLAIYQISPNTPHYVLAVGDDTLDITKGRNNLFHTILLFLYIVKTKEHGMLGRVNLGPSGVNVLWVIQD